MTKILLVETASPRRVRARVEELIRQGEPASVVTILCSQDPQTREYFSDIPGVEVVAWNPKHGRSILRDLRRRGFHTAWLFWTGERRYRRMKWRMLRTGAAETRVDIGDGSSFRLTWKAWPRFFLFRASHPLPSDHWEFVPRPERRAEADYYRGERILIVQSADPPHVLRALEHLRRAPIFRNPTYTLFCRNKKEIVDRLEGHPMIGEIVTHSETRGWFGHLRQLRRRRFDGLVVFFTGDPSYWKIKFFAFLVGARHRVVFNENNDCFFFSPRSWLSLLAHRASERSRDGLSSQTVRQVRIVLLLLLKLLLFPLRFAWLLLVWVRLRLAG